MKLRLFATGAAVALLATAGCLTTPPPAAGPLAVRFAPDAGALALAAGGTAAPIFVAPGDWPGVVRAARDLQADVERVTGAKPALGLVTPRAPIAVLVGTLGRSPLIDDLVRRGRLDAAPIAGKWESFLLTVVADPLPGVARALVIAGSDKRGTIYGVYELSERIGVSPWYWWADVTPERRDALYVTPGRVVQGEPSVKYRGIFLNDEAPDLTNWVRARFGPAPLRTDPPVPAGVANYGREFYTRLFEVLLRLRGNYLWPAMWNNAFNEDDPDNARLADEFGVVMGTSHQEPMLRAQKEWDRRFLATIGTWNYAKHPEVMERFWRDGLRRNKDYESIVTMGLRGANDTEMAPGGPAANRALLEKIIDVQRGLLHGEINPDVTKVPQLWCLYKEVQDFYEAGMRVPDDITLLWAEDNWGNVRRLPTPDERKRPGGAGIYYHFDYHGGPRSYQWLNTSPLPKIWDQMSLAKQYGADRIWIVNVGHFKGYEVPTEFFLRLGYDTSRWHAGNVGDFTRAWAAREFGPAHASEIAALVDGYAKFNGRRKPEQLAPDTYSLVNYLEAETVVADYRALAARADAVAAALPAAKRDAFYQLVQFPVQASALVHELYLAAGKNSLYAKQGRASAGTWAVETRRLFQRYLDMVTYYHRDLAGGKWDHFMDQPVLGYTSWRDPPVNNLNHLRLSEPAVPEAAALGVAVEGTTEVAQASPPAPSANTGESPALRFDALARQRHYLEIFNRGKTPFDFTATPSAPWVRLNAARGTVGPDQRLWIEIDWATAPRGRATAEVRIAGAGTEATIPIEAFAPADVTRESLRGFAESEGCVAIEPEHFTANLPAGANRWVRLADYGRTLSGLRAEGPADTLATPGKDAPCLEYRMHLFGAGEFEVTAITGPTLNFMPDRGLRYAVAFDNEPPQVVTVVPKGFKAQNGNRVWEKSVSDSARTATSKHTLAAPGAHTLKVWMVDPGVVLQKLIVNTGGLRPSYLGPPESPRGPVALPTHP